MSDAQTVELALREEPQAVMLTTPQLRLIANTDFVPKSMRGNIGAVLACVARGRAMGIPDMVALNGIAIIEGKATLSAELMVAIVREHGHSITGDVSATSAVVRGRRRDNGDEMTAEFTTAMAEAAGLLGKSNWRRHPDDMMWARAVSKLCRRLFADCFAGGTYTPEDIADHVDVTADEVLDEEQGVEQPVAAEVPITEAQKKKANVLVGNLRDALRLTTGEVYLAAGRAIPDVPEGEVLHWSPLRDALSKREASLLIDRLQRYEESGADQPPLDEWAGSSTSVSTVTSSLGASGDSGQVEALVEELLELVDQIGKRDTAVKAIAAKRETATDAQMVRWLKGQIDRAREATGAPA